MKQWRTGIRLFAKPLACLAVAAILLAGATSPVTGDAGRSEPGISGSLVGWMLVAAPRMRDPRFDRTVIFLAHHDDKGAMGLIVNRLISRETASRLLQRMLDEEEPNGSGREIGIHYGGPVQHSHWNFLHSGDYADSATTVITERISMTSSREILLALAKGKGPSQGFLAIGYAGWGPGQLENEIRRKSWVTIRPDDGIVFDDDMQSKWHRAMDKRGLDL